MPELTADLPFIKYLILFLFIIRHMISYDSPALNDYLVLAEFRDGRITLNDSNLRALSSFNRGRIILVCFE